MRCFLWFQIPATCLCIVEMGVALIHVPLLSPWLPASLLGKALQVIIQEMCWRKVRMSELKARLAENSASVIPVKENQWGDGSFREN